MNNQLTQFILEELQLNHLSLSESQVLLANREKACEYVLKCVQNGRLTPMDATPLLTEEIQTKQPETVDYTRDIFIERNGQQMLIKPHQLTNDELVSLFLENIKKHNDKKTYTAYKSDLTIFINWWTERYGDHAYWKMTYREAEAYVEYIQKEIKKKNGQLYSVSARNRMKSAVSTFYAYLDDKYTLLDNNKPYEKRNEIKNLPHLNDEERKDRVLTFDECRRLFEVIANSRRGGRSDYTMKRNYAFYRLLLRLGTRITETTLLEITDFDFENRILHIRKEIAKFKKARDIMIPDDLMEDLLAYLAYRLSLDLDSPYMFPTSGGKPIDPKESNNTLKTYLKEAGIDCEGAEKITNHTFRHTHITHEVYATDRNALDICKSVGHANVQTLLERYLKATDLKALGGEKVVNGVYPY